MEPELGSLETSEMIQEDHSENHSSISDIIHLEAELHEREESDDEDLQSSVLSIIDSDYRELAEIEAHVAFAEPDLRPPQAVELLMCVEEPIVEEAVEEAAAVPVFTHTPLLSEPLDFTLASVPIPEIISQVLDHLPQSEETQTTESEPTNAPGVSQAASPSEEFVSKADSLSGSPFELPVLLVGGAALVAVLGVLTYSLSRK